MSFKQQKQNEIFKMYSNAVKSDSTDTKQI